VLESAGIKVVVVSFGNQTGAEQWLKDTGCNLPLYLDEERLLYCKLGLGRSVGKVWSLSTINYYAEQLAQGRPLPQAVQGVEDDPLQMGGDFTFRMEDRTLVMKHCSKTPKDRPSLTQILQRLKSLN